MNCQDSKEMLMGYLDGELSETQRRQVEEHLQICRDCRHDLADFRKLIAITGEVCLQEPEARLWEQYWGGVYNRLERGAGWILFGAAAICLLIYGGFKMIEAVIRDPSIGLLLKIGLLALLAGLAILLVSVARERLYFWKKDRYKDVIR